VGTLAGLSVYDLGRQTWESITPYNSALTAGDVTALASDPQRQILYIGHGYAGLDIFDARRNSWRHLATVNGLPHNKVEGIAVADGGEQVWIACGVGAALWTGAELKAWTMPEIGVVGELTNAVTTGPGGTAWLISSGGSLLRYARGKWKVYAAAETGGAPLQPDAGIATTRDGTVWFVSTRDELLRLDPATGRCARHGSMRGGNGLMAGPDGSLIAATDTGVQMLAPAGNATPRSYAVTGDVLRSNRIVALAEDRGGTIWIATGAGMYTLRRSGAGTTLAPLERQSETIGRGNVLALYADPRGGMWFGTTSGAAHFNGSSWRRFGKEQGVVGDTVRALVRDGKGQIWFGTTRGINVWDGAKMRSITRRDGLRSEDVHALFARGDVVWAGTREFMFRFQGDKLEFLDDEVMGVEFETMRMIAAFKSDSLVLGTSNGLAYIDGRTGRDDMEIYGDPVTGLAVVHGDELWVGTETRGLFHRAGATWSNLTTQQGLPSNIVTSLLMDHEGTLWIGTYDAGIARYTP
jgi:ligand-binding sensor domain-containing protein